nr:MAG: hypothetical protein [Bacteriophage sp.]
MDYFLFNFSGVQFHYTMSQKLMAQIIPLIQAVELFCLEIMVMY